jgi:type I restriction enzyme, S subunit
VSGCIPAGWKLATLDDVAVWSSGGTPSRSNPSFYTGEIPWFKTGELGPKTIVAAEEYITRQAVASSSAKLFPRGSVALAMYGATIGRTSILGVDATTNQACAVDVPKAVSSEFLYYYLVSQTKAFIDAGQGGAQRNISQGVVRSWPILVPPRGRTKPHRRQARRRCSRTQSRTTEIDTLSPITAQGSRGRSVDGTVARAEPAR